MQIHIYITLHIHMYTYIYIHMCRYICRFIYIYTLPPMCLVSLFASGAILHPDTCCSRSCNSLASLLITNHNHLSYIQDITIKLLQYFTVLTFLANIATFLVPRVPTTQQPASVTTQHPNFPGFKVSNSPKTHQHSNATSQRFLPQWFRCCVVGALN